MCGIRGTLKLMRISLVSGAALGFLGGAIFWIGLTLVYTPDEIRFVGQAAGAIFAGSAVLVAVSNLALQRRSGVSNDYLRESIASLERFYSVLAPNDQLADDRLSWLTAGRELMLFRRLALKVKLASHRDVLEAHEIYWRAKTFDLLNPSGEYLPESFFMHPEFADSKGMWVKIAPTSIAAIYGFAAWNPELEDSLLGIDFSAELKKDPATLAGSSGMKKYLARFDKISKELGLGEDAE